MNCGICHCYISDGANLNVWTWMKVDPGDLYVSRIKCQRLAAGIHSYDHPEGIDTCAVDTVDLKGCSESQESFV